MGRNGKIRRAPGFADRLGRDFERLETAANAARELLYARGYQPIETPLIEHTELFLRRSGGLLSSQLFDFSAPDGSSIALRPELTAPVIRHALEQGIVGVPMRYQYAAPIFRYTERPYDAPPNSIPSRRQFIQAGAELIGASQPAADGEIITTAFLMAKRLGVEAVVIRIGHVGVIRGLLRQFNLSDRANMFLANNISDLSTCTDEGQAVKDEAVRAGLMGQNAGETQSAAADLLARLASGSVKLPNGAENTSRSAEEVVAGLRQKLEHQASNAEFAKALEFTRQLSQIQTYPVDPANQESEQGAVEAGCGTTLIRHSDAIHKVRNVTDRYGLVAPESLDNLSQIIEAVEWNGVGNFDYGLDFGLARSIAYYSGMIFDIYAVVDGEYVLIGGGGRYDGLASALGSEQALPALGFALDLDAILELTDEADGHRPKANYTVLIPADDSSDEAVAKAAYGLRNDGHQVVTLFAPDDDPFALAEVLGGAEVVRVDRDGCIEAVVQ